MNYKTISLYKYINIEDPESLKNKIRNLCMDLHILGRILIGKEGINAAVSGKIESIEKFKKELKRDPKFSDLTFREQLVESNSYHKLVVKVREEIVHFGEKVDLTKTGEYLPPEKLKEMYDNREDFVIIDVRNDYETKIGKFEDALTLPIKTFREFPKEVKNLENLKDRKVVMYCTGGIRCEKASAFLKQQGFDKVYQLEGGIINFVNQFPNTYWKGGLFVFDDRVVSNLGEPITECEICNVKTNECINCFNLDCDRLTVMCKECQQKMNHTCSDKCKKAKRQRKGFDNNFIEKKPFI